MRCRASQRESSEPCHHVQPSKVPYSCAHNHHGLSAHQPADRYKSHPTRRPFQDRPSVRAATCGQQSGPSNCVSKIHTQRNRSPIFKVAVLAIEPEEYSGPWVLESGFSLAAGDHIFLPLARYGEALRANYTSSVFDRSDSFLEIVTKGVQPKPSKESVHFLTLRATGIGSAPSDYRCKL
jgi:hypothetical protein